MEFWAAVEAHRPAYPLVSQIRKRFEPALSTELRAGALGEIDVKVRYVPIVMPKDMLDQYPSRSGVKKRQMLCECAPQLEYDLFVGGDFERGLAEYVRGLDSAAAELKELGLSEEAVGEFRAALTSAQARVLEGWKSEKLPLN